MDEDTKLAAIGKLEKIDASNIGYPDVRHPPFHTQPC